jgi:hypothetical protein
MGVMDIDKFRSQWDDPKFEQSYAQLDQEPPSEIIQRMKIKHLRDDLWHRIHQIILKASLLVILALATFMIYVTDSRETPLQSGAFILELAVFCGMQLLDKARKKYVQAKLWLAPREFLLDEHRRIAKNIRLDQWVSALLSIAVACAGMYAAPFLSAGLKLACLAVTGAAIIVLQVYDHRRISQLKRSRDNLAAQLDDLQCN